jgi:hypothetical protein
MAAGKSSFLETVSLSPAPRLLARVTLLAREPSSLIDSRRAAYDRLWHMRSLISFLPRSEQRKLLDDLNYLNMEEIREFCDEHKVPYTIWVESADKRLRETRDDDRKGVILDRIRQYLTTGCIPEATIFSARIVCYDERPAKLKATDRLFYGQYDKKSEAMINLLKSLTGGRFRNGAIARILAREFWSKGIAPTYQEYAEAWLEANGNHKRPRPEWAFLSDRADHTATANWKKQRQAKAKYVLSILSRID